MRRYADDEKRQAQLEQYEPARIEADLRKAATAGVEYGAAIGMIRGTAYTVESSDAERLTHITRILDALEKIVTTPES